MKTILSFLKPVSAGLAWIRDGFVMLWRISKWHFFPTEKNFLLSFWYDFVHFKARKAGGKVAEFWDDRIVFIKEELEDPEKSRKKKQLYRDLLSALYDPDLRQMIFSFLESSPPEDYYLPVVEAMKRAWRDDGEEPDRSSDEQQDPEGHLDPEDPDLPAAQPDEPALHAKTYFIAAELYYDLEGRQDEFQVLCREMGKLVAFVQKQFGVARLPGTFNKLKGYSYKGVLAGKNAAKKGQLKPHFRQIADHPAVFGEAIIERARAILTENFN